MTVSKDTVQYRKREEKHCSLAAAILLFIGKIILTFKMASMSRLEALFLYVTSDALNNCSF